MFTSILVGIGVGIVSILAGIGIRKFSIHFFDQRFSFSRWITLLGWLLILGGIAMPFVMVLMMKDMGAQ